FNQLLGNCIVSDREKYPLLPTSIYGNKKVEGYDDVMRSIEPEKVVFSVQSLLGI
ncbi:MAG: ADP-heptose--LPS heptosyltransferase RfaF, partial [Bacteroidetes bacterium HGW-Bacteroidetes-23]